MAVLRKWIKYLPTLLLAYFLATAVWISAVSASDPTVERTYPRNVPLEIIGQDPGQVIVSTIPTQLSIKLSAPTSIWDQLTTEPQAVRALVDLSNLSAGTHTVPIRIQVAIQPVKLISQSPKSIEIELDNLASRSLQIELIRRGELAVGFQLGNLEMSNTEVSVSGPENEVMLVNSVRAILDINNSRESIEREVELQAVDENEMVVNGVTLSPNTITLSQTITQRGGYRNVVVKAVLNGQVATGYRVTNISVFPPAVTVFSTDPVLVDQLPGYVETIPLDLTGVKDDVDVRLELNLPAGISIVGEPTVALQVGVATIEGSLTLMNMPVEITGLKPGFEAAISPSTVDVILSGPLPVLDALQKSDVKVYVDLDQEGTGSYQRNARVVVNAQDVTVESILPGTLEIIIKVAGKSTLTPTWTAPESENSPTQQVTP